MLLLPPRYQGEKTNINSSKPNHIWSILCYQLLFKGLYTCFLFISFVLFFKESKSDLFRDLKMNPLLFGFTLYIIVIRFQFSLIWNKVKSNIMSNKMIANMNNNNIMIIIIMLLYIVFLSFHNVPYSKSAKMIVCQAHV